MCKFLWFILLSISLTLSLGVKAQQIKIYETNVVIGEKENEQEALDKAINIIRVKAITESPRFVTLSTRYDSKDDVLTEQANILQAADVKILEVTKGKTIANGQFVLSVRAKTQLDSKLYQKAEASERKASRLQHQLDSVKADVEALLSAVKDTQEKTLSPDEINQIVVLQNRIKEKSSDKVMETEHLMAVFEESILFKEAVNEAYELIVFPYFKNAIHSATLGIPEVANNDLVYVNIGVSVSLSILRTHYEIMETLESPEKMRICNMVFRLGCESYEIKTDKDNHIIFPETASFSESTEFHQSYPGQILLLDQKHIPLLPHLDSTHEFSFYRDSRWDKNRHKADKYAYKNRVRDYVHSTTNERKKRVDAVNQFADTQYLYRIAFGDYIAWIALPMVEMLHGFPLEKTFGFYLTKQDAKKDMSLVSDLVRATYKNGQWHPVGYQPFSGDFKNSVIVKYPIL